MKKYPRPRIEKFKTLRGFLDSQLAELLPNQDLTIKHHRNLVEYLESESPLYVVRKFINHRNRGSIYYFEKDSFTVSDNEPALWVFMESFYQSELDFFDLIGNQRFPIAFALKKEEKHGNRWQNIGRKHQEFSAKGWKHCHIFQCSPSRKTIVHKKDLKVRSLRLLSPLNHFPFFSPKKYEMPFVYGEKEDCIEYVIWWLYNHFYTDKNKAYFKAFIEEQNFVIPIDEPKDIKIEYSIKNIYHSKTKKTDEVNANSKSTNKINRIASKTNQSKGYFETTYFKISENWYGKGMVITVRFNAGRIYQYHHDEVYDNTISHYGKLDCWVKHGYFSNSNNIPGCAQEFVTEL